MRAPNTLTTPLAGRASSSTFSVFRSKFRPRSSSSAPQPSHAPSPSPSPPPSISPSLKPWGPKWASGRTEHSSEIQTKPLLPPPPHQGGEASVPSQQRLQEFGEACGRGEGRRIRGVEKERAPSSRLCHHGQTHKHSNPACPRQKHSSKVSGSTAFNKDQFCGRGNQVRQESPVIKPCPRCKLLEAENGPGTGTYTPMASKSG